MKKMFIGKRSSQLPPLKGTTSMSEVTFDIDTSCSSSSDSDNNDVHPPPSDRHMTDGGFDGYQLNQPFLTGITRIRRASADFARTSRTDFLNSCKLCGSRLIPSLDVYMYRGDSAFCSLECRQQQMFTDEKRERYSLLASKKKSGHVNTTVPVKAASPSETTVLAV